MRQSALASALKDFGQRRVHAASPFAAPPERPRTDVELPNVVEIATPEPQVDVAAAVREAVAEAESALAERLAAEHAKALQAERERNAQELADLQLRFAEEAGVKIRHSVEEMEQRVLELTGAVTARILGTLLTDDIRDRSIEKLGAIIRDALHDGDAVRIRVSGNPTLYEALKQKLAAHIDQLDYSESPSFDLSVTIDDSVFETRLAEWSSALAETLS